MPIVHQGSREAQGGESWEQGEGEVSGGRNMGIGSECRGSHRGSNDCAYLDGKARVGIGDLQRWGGTNLLNQETEERHFWHGILQEKEKLNFIRHPHVPEANTCAAHNYARYKGMFHSMLYHSQTMSQTHRNCISSVIFSSQQQGGLLQKRHYRRHCCCVYVYRAGVGIIHAEYFASTIHYWIAKAQSTTGRHKPNIHCTQVYTYMATFHQPYSALHPVVDCTRNASRHNMHASGL